MDKSIAKTITKVKEGILEALKKEIKKGNCSINIGRRASGSASGLPFEEWAKNAIENNYPVSRDFPKIRVYLQEEFLKEVVDTLKSRGYQIQR